MAYGKSSKGPPNSVSYSQIFMGDLPIISHHRDEDDDCSNGMYKPTQNCRDDVEQYAENRAPQLDGKRTGRNAFFH
jgi:hypothetical protein